MKAAMIKIAICDDDTQDRNRIQDFIIEYAKEKKLTYNLKVFESGEQYSESRFIPDILFLDILMDKLDGIQLGWEIRNSENRILVIYTTNLKEKMAKAFNQIHSFGFLLKPIDRNDFFEMMDDALAEIDKNRYISTVTFQSENNTLISLPVMDIYYFEYANRKIKIIAKDKNYTCINEKITDIAEKMEQYGFVIAHQSFAVNLYHVDKITSQYLVMKNGDVVCLAQKRAAAVRKKLMQIVKETITNGESKE